MAMEMRSKNAEAVDAIIAWLDKRIDRKEMDMAECEDDSSWLASMECLHAYRNARSHITALYGTDKCTVHSLAEWCSDRKREAEGSLQRLLESSTPYGNDAIVCADLRRFAYQVVINHCEDLAKTDINEV